MGQRRDEVAIISSDESGDAHAALARGDNLRAYDIAAAALDRAPGDARLAHTVVLALARSGASRRAEEQYERLGLGDAAAATEDAGLSADLLALGGRLAKDRALESTGEERRRWATTSCDRYASSGAGNGYGEVNAATMAAVAGDLDRARHHARRALAAAEAPEDEPSIAGDAAQGYWRAATAAEAWCVLGDRARAATALGEADGLAASDLGAKATTRRQLMLLADAGFGDASLLDHLTMPGVVAFGGHRLVEGAAGAADLALRMAAVVAHHHVGVAHGSLACGADILWAEALLAVGAELHIVLPFDAEEFIATSVRPGGEGWVRRHHTVLDAAATVTVSSPGASLGDAALYGYAASLFLGRALVRARAMTVTPRFLVLWNGTPAAGPAGTAADVEKWQAAGQPLDVVHGAGTLPPAPSHHSARPRQVRAAIFGDFAGFSRLTDAETPGFVERSLTTIADVLDAAGDRVLYRNSWGDGIYVVCESAPAAAELALALQAAIDGGPAASGALRLRLGGHLGPMFRLFDPVQRQDAWWGHTVVTAARIEPRTPAGEVYVTEAFAALLSLEAGHAFTAEYVGRLATAKDFGTMAMYVLKARPGQ